MDTKLYVYEKQLKTLSQNHFVTIWEKSEVL